MVFQKYMDLKVFLQVFLNSIKNTSEFAIIRKNLVEIVEGCRESPKSTNIAPAG